MVGLVIFWHFATITRKFQILKNVRVQYIRGEFFSVSYHDHFVMRPFRIMKLLACAPKYKIYYMHCIYSILYCILQNQHAEKIWKQVFLEEDGEDGREGARS